MSKIMPSTLWNAVGRHTISVQPLSTLRLFSVSCINYLPNKIMYAKIKADPGRYKQLLLRTADYQRNRYKNDPEYRKKAIESTRLLHVEYKKTSKRYRRYRSIYRWVSRYDWFREQLPWRSHHPLYSSERIKHSCANCPTRGYGTRLWWKSNDSESYSCHACQ